MPAPAAEPTPAPSDPEQLFQYIESKVVEILRDEGLTPEDAATQALIFMDVTNAGIVDQLLVHGEPGLRWAFENRPILKRIPPGPRLDAFIKAFVAGGSKVSVPEVDPTKPAS
jgi:hypothetical protein